MQAFPSRRFPPRSAQAHDCEVLSRRESPAFKKLHNARIRPRADFQRIAERLRRRFVGGGKRRTAGDFRDDDIRAGSGTARSRFRNGEERNIHDASVADFHAKRRYRFRLAHCHVVKGGKRMKRLRVDRQAGGAKVRRTEYATHAGVTCRFAGQKRADVCIRCGISVCRAPQTCVIFVCVRRQERLVWAQ